MNASGSRLLVLCLLTACSKAQPASTATPMTPAPAHGSVAPATATGTVTGPVLETMNAASYTYVRVKGENGDVWAAAPEFPVKVGERVRISLEMPMVNFHSTSLNRDFPLLYFVSRITPADAAAPAVDSASAQTGADPHAGARSTAPAVTTPMAPPAGGITIAKLWADRQGLAGKTITVHGVVTKYNAGILGQTWIHLQDGTGDAKDGSNDVTVTSTEDVPAKVGDTLQATGTVVLDKNIGAGYAYPVLLESAKVTLTKTSGS